MRSTHEAGRIADSRYAIVAAWLYRRRHGLIVFLMCFFILALSVLTVSKPIYEWDLLPYMANAMLATQDRSPSDLHAAVYQAVVAGVPSEDYARLIGSPSRLVLSRDIEAFSQTMIFFYDARVVYIKIMSVLLELGLEPVFAFYFFSTMCVVLSYLVLTRLIPVPVPMGMHLVLPFIVLAFGLMYVARLATPDALAALCTIALYALLLRNRIYWLLVLFPLLIFIRTDLVFLVALFFLYFFFTKRVARPMVLLSAMATIASYLILNHFIVDGEPWSSLIGYNFGEKPTHPADYVFPVTPLAYLKILQQQIFTFSYTPMVFVFFVFSISGVVLLTMRYVRASGQISMSQLHVDLLFLFLSGVAYFAIHFLLFPVSWMRFFAPQYTLAATAVCWCLFSMHSRQHNDPEKGLGFLRHP